MARVNRRWVLLLIDEPVEVQLVASALKSNDVWVRTAPRDGGQRLALEIQFATWKDARFALRVMKRVAKWPNTVGEGVAQIKSRIKEEAQRETQNEDARQRIDWEVVDNKVVRKADAQKGDVSPRPKEFTRADAQAEADAEAQGLHILPPTW